jgi:hypothetical protein
MPDARQSGGRGGTPPRSPYAPSAPTQPAIAAGITAIVRALEVLVGLPSGVQIELTAAASSGVLKFLWNNSSWQGGEIFGSLAAGFAQIVLNGPAGTAAGHTDFVGEEWNAGSGSGSANWELVYNNANGNAYLIMSGGSSGVNIEICQEIRALQPGTGGTPTNAPVAESWHQVGTAGQPAFQNSWGNSSGTGCRFRLLPIGDGLVEIYAEVVNTTATGNSIVFTLPAGYVPDVATNHVAGWNNPASSNSATVPWVFVDTSGDVQLTGIEVADKGIFFHIFVPLTLAN